MTRAPAAIFVAYTLITAGVCDSPLPYPPSLAFTLPAACGPSPEGDCCVFLRDPLFGDGFESGGTSAWGVAAGPVNVYAYRRVCCGGGCNNHWPAPGDSPALANEAAYRQLCEDVAVPGAPP